MYIYPVIYNEQKLALQFSRSNNESRSDRQTDKPTDRQTDREHGAILVDVHGYSYRVYHLTSPRLILLDIYFHNGTIINGEVS